MIFHKTQDIFFLYLLLIDEWKCTNLNLVKFSQNIQKTDNKNKTVLTSSYEKRLLEFRKKVFKPKIASVLPQKNKCKKDRLH